MEKEEKREDLGTFLKRLIAEVDEVKPEEVTVEYIREQRKKLYRTLRFPCEEGLKSYTLDELDEIKREADEFLKSFSSQ